MRFAIIGRTKMLLETAHLAVKLGHELVCVITSKEAPEYNATTNDFQDLAHQLNAPFAKGSNILEFYEVLKSSKADIALSINYTGVIPSAIIDLFQHGILNAHGGDLPRYRGNACQAWAIINGEDRIGLCIHRMIGGELDSGDIIARDYLNIDHTTKVTHVWEWMSVRTPELMLDAVQILDANPDYVLEKQSKDPAHALRCYPRKPEDGRIDWTKSAIDVLRLINASNKPYAGAYCDFEGENLIIWDAELVSDNEVFCAVPGQVTTIGDGFIEVACGVEKLRVALVDYRGKVSSPTLFIQSIRKRFV